MQYFEDEMYRLICFLSAISVVLGIGLYGIQVGMARACIIVAIVVIVGISAFSAYIKEGKFRKLNSKDITRRRVNVIRNGVKENLNIN